MNDTLYMLDNALELAKKEKIALEEGSYEEAIELAKERGNIFSTAWSSLTFDNRQAYQKKLQEILSLQNQLTQLASEIKTGIRNSLNRSRQEQKRIKGYHLAVGQALH